MPTIEGDEPDIEVMPSIRHVMQYGNLTYHEALDLPTDTFLQMLKNHVVDELNNTEEGRAYLADCKRLNQKEHDLAAIRKFQAHFH